MKFSLFVSILFYATCTLSETNVTGIAHSSYLLIDKVYEEDGKLRPAIDWIESSSGDKRPKDPKQLRELHTNSTRIFVLADTLKTNQMIYVIASYPFPKISGSIVSTERNIFIPGNIVELQLDKISGSHYQKKLSNLFVRRTNSSAGEKYHEPYSAEKEPALYKNSIGFYVLKDIRSFTMTNPEACSNNWYNLYNRYKTKIIIRDN